MEDFLARWEGEPTTLHHRLPHGLGGTRRWPKGNTEVLPESAHQLWHRLFFIWRADWIADDINRKYLRDGYQVRPSLLVGKRIHTELREHKRHRIRQAPKLDLWEELFPSTMSTATVVDAINGFFIDPRYVLLLVRQEARAVAAG